MTEARSAMVASMEGWSGWPEPVREHIRRMYGVPVAVERLGGMSVARVYRARFAEGSLIVKTSPRPAESLFYERVAGRLRQAGVAIPGLEWVAHLPDGHWLIIEDVPEPLPVPPRERWRPDPRVVAALVRLHRATRDWALDFPESRAREWSDDATDAALTCFPAGAARGLAPLLRALQQEARRLAEGWCWISGDPSPPNWGVRGDGSAVLYDWELFRRGLPATDVAITVAGLGDTEKYRLAAGSYLEEWSRVGGGLPWTAETIARDIAVAKVGTVVMLLRAHADGAARVPAEHVAWLVEAVPGWVRSLG
jgi:hypothetical protein